jgi:hypothetical protein
MKKPIFLPIMTTLLLTMSFATSFAQTDSKTDHSIKANEDEITVSDDIVTVNKASLRAMSNFLKDYKQANNPEWTLLRDRSHLCVFTISGIPYRAFYNPNGSWSYTVSSYDGKLLNKVIHDRIQSVYYNYRILYVNQIDLSSYKTIYLVEIQDEKSIKKVRVADEEMDIIQDFKK